MDAQDMMEEMEKAEDMFSLCVHGVSQYRLCEYCERDWEKLMEQEGGEANDEFCKSLEQNSHEEAEG